MQRGRQFQPGQSGNPNGRRSGSKNKLTEVFLSGIAGDFAEHGADVIALVRQGDPVAYLKLISSLVPRELVVQREREPAVDLDNIGLSELIELIEQAKRRQFIRGTLMSAETGGIDV